MKQKIDFIKNYLDVLTKDTGWQIIIEDYFSILRPFKEIENYLSDKNWHTNPYCLTIKSNPKLWKRCAALKWATRLNTKRRAIPGWNVCYCGVAEYTIPIFVGNVYVATICVAGFFAPISQNMLNILSRRTAHTINELNIIRQTSLISREKNIEERLCGYLLPIAKLIEDLAKNSPLINTDSTDKPEQKHQYYLKAIEYIEKYYFDDITPQTIAEAQHISLSYLQHLFLRFTGEGVASTIRRKRLEKACELLAQTKRSIKDIAISCGFYNTDYFSIIFRRYYGITPLSFRNTQKNKY